MNKFIIRRNGTVAAPGTKIVIRGTVKGGKVTYKTQKQAHFTPVTGDLILTENNDYLNTELSDRITTG